MKATFADILASGLPCFVIRYHIVEMITGCNEARHIYEVVAYCDKAAMLLGMTPEYEIKRYRGRICFRRMRATDIQHLRKVAKQADARLSTEYGEIWVFNNFKVNQCCTKKAIHK